MKTLNKYFLFTDKQEIDSSQFKSQFAKKSGLDYGLTINSFTDCLSVFDFIQKQSGIKEEIIQSDKTDIYSLTDETGKLVIETTGINTVIEKLYFIPNQQPVCNLNGLKLYFDEKTNEFDFLTVD